MTPDPKPCKRCEATGYGCPRAGVHVHGPNDVAGPHTCGEGK